MKNLKILVVLLLVFSASTSFAGLLNINEYTLENGLKVLILEDHKSPTATFQVWYRVGSRDEQTGKTGLSHLLEHMMFKGTKKYGPKTFSQTIKRAGGIDNAFTTKDYTAYFQLLTSSRIELPVELESDRMTNLVLSPGLILSERDVVMEERRMRYEDDPHNLVFEEVVAAAFRNHPYRWPVIGWMSDLKSLNPEDLVNHYHTYYAPNNAVIIVVGDVDTEKILSEIKSAFGRIPKGPEIKRAHPLEPQQRGEKRLYIEKEAELPYMLSAYKVPDIKHKDSAALEVLGYILSEGKSSRFYRELVYKKQIAADVWANYANFYRDPFLFFIGATAARGTTAEELEGAVIAELERIKKSPPSEREVQKAKNQVEASFIMEQDSVYMQARTIGTFEMTGGWRLIDAYLEGIRKVTPEDVSRAAEKYLIKKRRTTGILVPVKKDRDK